MHVCAWWKCTSVQSVPSPLLTSSTDLPQGDDAILSEKVSGELVPGITVEECECE